MESSKKREISGKTQLEVGGDTIEVSYAVISLSSGDSEKVLAKFATSLNVQLGLQPGQLLPYIPFKGFDKVKGANKLFIYGPSGCGKSRCIYELIKDMVTSFGEIYVINPRHTAGMSESGRAPLAALFTRFGKDDAIVWDNFPDDIINIDIDIAKKFLKI